MDDILTSKITEETLYRLIEEQGWSHAERDNVIYINAIGKELFLGEKDVLLACGESWLRDHLSYKKREIEDKETYGDLELWREGETRILLHRAWGKIKLTAEEAEIALYWLKEQERKDVKARIEQERNKRIRQ